ncbi:hypothetical protein J3E71DRAFT_243537 [Bipolaris maydis]|nr:hypothetical protein J3E71DRAFT_243537 [Bipolaris maydis]
MPARHKQPARGMALANAACVGLGVCTTPTVQPAHPLSPTSTPATHSTPSSTPALHINLPVWLRRGPGLRFHERSHRSRCSGSMHTQIMAMPSICTSTCSRRLPGPGGGLHSPTAAPPHSPLPSLTPWSIDARPPGLCPGPRVTGHGSRIEPIPAVAFFCMPLCAHAHYSPARPLDMPLGPSDCPFCSSSTTVAILPANPAYGTAERACPLHKARHSLSANQPNSPTYSLANTLLTHLFSFSISHPTGTQSQPRPRQNPTNQSNPQSLTGGPTRTLSSTLHCAICPICNTRPLPPPPRPCILPVSRKKTSPYMTGLAPKQDSMQ